MQLRRVGSTEVYRLMTSVDARLSDFPQSFGFTKSMAGRTVRVLRLFDRPDFLP